MVADERGNTVDVVRVSTYEGLSHNEEPNDTVIPDFRGMSMREVLRISQRMGIEARVSGSGWAVSQKPAPGSPADEHQSCYVSFRKGL